MKFAFFYKFYTLKDIKEDTNLGSIYKQTKLEQTQ